jgi:predicted O-linked N-acetylglucosamine transferase (SPINDLY family)
MRSHSVACFFEALLESMDRDQYISYCYADVARPDDTTARLRNRSSHWRNIAGTDVAAICNRILGDRIDILVDLAGHTSSRNMAVLAARPAPVQITWLGYPDTTGLDCVDYRLTDTHADPEEHSTPATEELVRLEGGFLCYQPPPGSPEISALPATQNGFVTFGSFNNLAKLNDRVLELWARLLGRVANARLYLKNPSFTDEATRARCHRKLVDLGISPERITLTGRTRSREEHLQLYSEIDIALDCFPYNGTTTTCEALWMGVPVVVKKGDTHAGRVGVSLLNAVGRSEWIGPDDEAYLQIAMGLASDIEALARIRDRLRDDMRHSRLCDSKHFATSFTKALRTMWETYCASADG